MVVVVLIEVVNLDGGNDDSGDSGDNCGGHW